VRFVSTTSNARCFACSHTDSLGFTARGSPTLCSLISNAPRTGGYPFPCFPLSALSSVVSSSCPPPRFPSVGGSPDPFALWSLSIPRDLGGFVFSLARRYHHLPLILFSLSRAGGLRPARYARLSAWSGGSHRRDGDLDAASQSATSRVSCTGPKPYAASRLLLEPQSAGINTAATKVGDRCGPRRDGWHDVQVLPLITRHSLVFPFPRIVFHECLPDFLLSRPPRFVLIAGVL